MVELMAQVLHESTEPVTIVSTGPTHKYLRKHPLSSPLNRHIYLN